MTLLDLSIDHFDGGCSDGPRRWALELLSTLTRFEEHLSLGVRVLNEKYFWSTLYRLDSMSGDLEEVVRRRNQRLELFMNQAVGASWMTLTAADDEPKTHYATVGGWDPRSARGPTLGLSTRTLWVLWYKYRTEVSGVLRVPTEVSETQFNASSVVKSPLEDVETLGMMIQIHRESDLGLSESLMVAKAL